MIIDSRLTQSIKHFISHYDLFDSKDRLILSFSGGPDSVFLFYVLSELHSKEKIRLIYFDHGLRGDECVQERDFVRSFALKQGVPVTIKKIPVLSFSKRYKCSVEMAGRECRYRFLSHLASLHQIKHVLTAHHLDDDIETLFLKGMRVKKGLIYGILPKRALNQNLMLLRPLLSISKQEILEGLHRLNLPYCLDSSNSSLSYQRNQIRLTGIPILKKKNPRFLIDYKQRLSDLREGWELISRTIPNCSDFLLKTPEALIFSLDILSFIPEWQKAPLISNFLRLAMGWITDQESKKSRLSFTPFSLLSTHYEQIMHHCYTHHDKPFIVSLPQNYSCSIDNAVIKIKKNTENSPKKSFTYTYSGKESRLYMDELGCYVDFRVIKNERSSYKSSPKEAFLNMDTFKGDIHIRNRKQGDLFHPFGQQGQKTIKKYFIDHKIPRTEREDVPLFFNQDRLIYVGGFQISDRVKINKDTKKILHLKVVHL